MRLLLGELTEVERSGNGVMLTVIGPGDISVDVQLDQDAAIEHVVAILALLEHPACERALKRAQARLEESVADRICRTLPRGSEQPPTSKSF